MRREIERNNDKIAALDREMAGLSTAGGRALADVDADLRQAEGALRKLQDKVFFWGGGCAREDIHGA